MSASNGWAEFAAVLRRVDRRRSLWMLRSRRGARASYRGAAGSGGKFLVIEVGKERVASSRYFR
jgi:hypothetical protein